MKVSIKLISVWTFCLFGLISQAQVRDSIGQESRLRQQVDSLINELEVSQSEKDFLQEKISLQVQNITNLEEQTRLLQETIEKLE